MSPGALSPLSKVKALTFDVFGTVVDWRSSVVEELTMRAHRKLSSDNTPEALRTRLASLTDDDWGRFAQEWRNSYGAFTRSFDPAVDAWVTVDEHHLSSLVALLAAWDLAGLYSPAETESLSLVWHRLSPWPDAPSGLAKLGARAVTSTLSNGNVDLLRDLDDFGGLGFQRLLSTETFRAYKPNPATYLGAARELGVEPAEVAMVAAHLGDLEAARRNGLRTIYVERAREESWAKTDERYLQAKEWVDLWVTVEEDGFLAVDRQLSEFL